MATIEHSGRETQLSSQAGSSTRPTWQSSDVEVDQSIPEDQPNFCFSRMASRQASRAGRASRAASKAKRRSRRYHHATSNSVHTREESLFIMAVDAWKTTTGRHFPTLSELLHVARSVGYHTPGQCACHHDHIDVG
jgi:hypothetical protein